MKSRLVLSAFFKFRNIGILLLLLGASVFLTDNSALTMIGSPMPALPDIVAFPASLVFYAILVMQTLLSKQFHDGFNKKEKTRHINDLNYQCSKLANDARRYTNTTYMQKLKKVIEDKNDIVDSYLRGERSYLKEKIAEQTLNLVVSYLKLLNNFCIRSRELSNVDVSTVAGRINTNNRKLSFAKDVHMADDIRRIIEMDEKLINRLKDEKKDLERISAKLDYMESTVNMFKHQIMSSVESEDMLEKLETAVNEAEALDTVLEDRRRRKVKGL
jgi:hypothetical protein